jgi:hypothetical protein
MSIKRRRTWNASGNIREDQSGEGYASTTFEQG